MDKRVVLGFALATAVACAKADTITVDGKRHEHVIVRESAALYYVQDPATGSVFSASKDKVPAGGYVPSVDSAERARLQAAWKAARPTKHIEAPKPTPAASAEAESDRATPRLSVRGNSARSNYGAEGRSDGKIPYLRLKNVPLGDALDATLRPLNLDYSVEGDIVYISSPDILARESFERVETRTYNVNLDTTLPKIVLSNPFAATAGNFSGGNLGSGGGGGGGFGANQGGGLGGQGGFGGNQGGFRGGNQGVGNQGGGFGNQNVRDVTSISNISELFTNIDDRLVGETPAQIGLGIQTRR